MRLEVSRQKVYTLSSEVACNKTSALLVSRYTECLLQA